MYMYTSVCIVGFWNYNSDHTHTSYRKLEVTVILASFALVLLLLDETNAAFLEVDYRMFV